MVLNIVHLNKNQFTLGSLEYNESVRREKSLLFEMQEQGAKYKVWDAIYNPSDGKVGCSQSHKQIVRQAKKDNLPFVLIAEDDIVFSGKGAYDFFLKSIPDSFDIYLGTSYSYHNYPDGKVQYYFDSTTIYAVHARYYDDFLALDENKHLDNALSEKVDVIDIMICQPYIAKQTDGYSFNQKNKVTNEWRLQGKEFFEG